jgi:hypothetical protein
MYEKVQIRPKSKARTARKEIAQKKKLKIRVQIFMDLVYHVEHLVGKPMQSDADTVFQV